MIVSFIPTGLVGAANLLKFTGGPDVGDIIEVEIDDRIVAQGNTISFSPTGAEAGVKTYQIDHIAASQVAFGQVGVIPATKVFLAVTEIPVSTSVS